MSITVVIPNLHSPLIGAVLAHLRAQTVRDQIDAVLVVGMDGPGLVRPDGWVQAIDTGRPISASAARNRGAALAQGERLLFLDADCLLAPDALEHLLAAHVASGYAATGGGVVPEPDQPYWVLCANLASFPANLSSSTPGPRDGLPSFCLLIDRQPWESCGPFDETFPGASAEDMDLSFKLRAAGYTLGCEPRARVVHRPNRRTAGALWQQHCLFGSAWYTVYRRHRAMLPRSEAMLLAERAGNFAAAAHVPLALIYTLRLFSRLPDLRRFWYALPGMVWAQLAWYTGLRIKAARAAANVRDL